MQSYFFIVAAFAVWRVTHLLAQEAGPANVLANLRRRADGRVWGELFNCFYCMSVWVAAAFTPCMAQGCKQCMLLWPALSGAAILPERISPGKPPTIHSFYIEEAEKEYVLR